MIMLGAKSLAVTLKESSQLTFLSLEWNQIGSDGVMFLAEALTFNTSLLHVDLRNNNIGDEGALELSKALVSNDTLKTLDLRWNQVSSKIHFLQLIFFHMVSIYLYFRFKMHHNYCFDDRLVIKEHCHSSIRSLKELHLYSCN